MHSFFALAAALLTATTLAAPLAAPAGAPQNPPYPTTISVTLMGATPEDQTTIAVPVDSTFHFTNFGSSISHVSTTGGPCGLFGIDGLVLEVPYSQFTDVGPPQTIVGVACGAKPWPQ